MGLFKRKQYQEEPETKTVVDDTPKERHIVKKTFYVTGTGYYQDNMMKLAIPNPEWDSSEPGTYHRYDFKKEPLVIDEDHDYPGSLKVMVDRLKIGVIRSGEVEEARKILQCEIKYMSAYISGGPNKTVCNDGEVLEDDKLITAKVSIGYIVEE